MPRYFFHVYDDFTARDGEGIDCADADAARAAALAGARELMCAQLKKGRLCLYHRIEIEDEGGEPVLTLSFGEAVRIETRLPTSGWIQGT